MGVLTHLCHISINQKHQCNISSDFFLQKFCIPIALSKKSVSLSGHTATSLEIYLFKALGIPCASRCASRDEFVRLGPIFLLSFISIAFYCLPPGSWLCQSQRLILEVRSNDAMELMNVFIWLFDIVLSKLSTPLHYIGYI